MSGNPYQTNSPVPSEEEYKKRNNAIAELRKQKIVHKAIKQIQKFLVAQGLEKASINFQIFPEFWEGDHIISDNIMQSTKGLQYFVNADLNSNNG